MKSKYELALEESWKNKKIPLEIIMTFNEGPQDFGVFEFTEDDLINISESDFIDDILHCIEGDVSKLIMLSFCLKFKDDKHIKKMLKKSEVVKAIQNNNGKYFFNGYGDTNHGKH